MRDPQTVGPLPGGAAPPGVAQTNAQGAYFPAPLASSGGLGALVAPPNQPAPAPSALPPDTEAPGFGAGVSSLFAGLKFVTSTPSVWPLAMVPVIFLLVLTGVIGFFGAAFLPKLIVPLLGPWAHKGHGALAIVVKVLGAIVSVLVGLGLGFVLSQPLSGPALEKIVRKMEGTLGVPAWPSTSLFQDIWRSIEGILLTTVLSLPLFALLFLIGAVFPPATVVTFPLKVALTGLVLAWDLCDYPLSIRGMSIVARVSFLRRHLAAVFGFGLGIALLSLIPCALLFALPIGAAGATRLVVRMERWEIRQKLQSQ